MKNVKKLTNTVLLAGVAENCVDIEYISGFRAPDPVVFLRHDKKRYLVVSSLEFGRAKRTCTGVNVLTPEHLGLKPQSRGKLSNWCVALIKHVGVNEVTIPSNFPVGIAKELEKKKVRLKIAHSNLFPERGVKSSAEITKIKDSQQAAVIAMRAAIAQIAQAEIDYNGTLKIKNKTITAEDIRKTIARILFEHNCQGRDTIVACGKQAADPHETGHGPLKANESIVIDIFPQHLEHGYWGDLTRTVIRGVPSPRLKRMYFAVKSAQNVALHYIKPGVKYSTIHKIAFEEIARRKFRTEVVNGVNTGFMHSTGHGVGLEIHEAPSIGRSDGFLKSGNVITIEPGLYYPELGGIRIEDTVVVTPHGWRYLVPCEKRFEI